MSTLQEKAAYLKGLADGMELDTTKDENKVIMNIVNLVHDIAQNIGNLEEFVDVIDEKVDEIDQDLGELEDYCYSDDDEYDEDEEYDDDDVYEFVCDNCGDTVYVNEELLDSDEKILCPNCGKEVKIDFQCGGDCSNCSEE